MCEPNNMVDVEINGKTFPIDSCLKPMIEALNAGGIHTKTCCCGHDNIPGFISLEDGRVLVIARNDRERNLVDILARLTWHEGSKIC